MLGYLLLASCGQEVPIPPAATAPPPPPPTPVAITRQSTALFVGVRDFTDNSLGTIQFSVDDAIDLAYAMVFDRKVRLVRAENVVLALAGAAVKQTSRDHLVALQAAGARITKADRATLLEQIDAQANAAGADGLLLFFFASHGFMHDGVGYVLASDSSPRDPQSALSVAKIAEVAARSPSERSVLFVDACRERVDAGTPRGVKLVASKDEPPPKPLNKTAGQAIFYATAPGGIALESNGNGVFTRFIIESITRCDAPKSRGAVTVSTLAKRLNERVHKWFKTTKHVDAGMATQTFVDTATADMPLAWCGTAPNPVALLINGPSFIARDEYTQSLWQQRAPARITAHEIVDLDDDGYSEVVIGDASGHVSLFTTEGELRWSQNTAGNLPVQRLVIGYLAGKVRKRHIVAVSSASAQSVLTIFTDDGTRLGRHEHDGPIVAAMIDRETSSRMPKLIAAGVADVFMLDRKAKELWTAPVDGVRGLRTIDVDNDALRDIEVDAAGDAVYLTFEGRRKRR